MNATRKMEFVGGQYGSICMQVAMLGGRLPERMYLRKVLTVEEEKALWESETVKWKGPEEVYVLKAGKYVFAEEIHYDPRHESYRLKSIAKGEG